MALRKHSKEEMLELRAKGMSNKQIAEKLGITDRTVHNNIGPQYGQQGRPDIKDEDILALHRQGMSQKAIAGKLGTTPITVSRRLKRLTENVNETPVKAPEPEKKPKVIHPEPIFTPQPIVTTQTARNPISTDLFEFAYCPSWPEQLWRLAGRTLPEPWGFKGDEWRTRYPETAILDNYLRTVFKLRAIEYNTNITEDPDKILLVRSGLVAFHTGLYTPEYKGLYAYCFPNRVSASMRDWTLMGFDTNTTTAFKNINVLPEHRQINPEKHKPFNPYWETRINLEHILGKPENLARLPESIQGAWNLPLLLETALNLARKRAAVMPQELVTSPRLDKMVYLLPLYLTNPDKPDVAAVLEDMDGYYHCRTCFTLHMAYLNARVNGRPTVGWLTDLV